MLSEVVDKQVEEVFTSLKLPPNWEERLVEKIQARDEVARIIEKRDRVKERLRRLGLAFVDGLYEEDEYRRQKAGLNSQLEGLVIPEIDAAREAGRLIQNVPTLWHRANLPERSRLLSSVLTAVYVNLESGSLTQLAPKLALRDLVRVGDSTLE